jgi:GH24 family phage-related lysozyme (muramidase)
MLTQPRFRAVAEYCRNCGAGAAWPSTGAAAFER